MRLFLRVLFTLYVLLVLFLIGVTLGCAWGLIDQNHPLYWVQLLYEDAVVFWSVTIGGIAVAILSVALMFSGVRKRKPRTATVKVSEGGTISITLSALEEMSTRYIAADASVRSVRATAAVREGKLIVKANLSVAEGTNIPEVLLALQTGLKAHIELLAGIEVAKIMLLVEKTAQVVKARVG